MTSARSLKTKARKTLPAGYSLIDIVPATDSVHKFTALFSHRGKIHRVHFGHRDYSDFTQHHDLERRAHYRARASKIRDGTGALTVTNPLSANFWSYNLLW